MIDHIQWTLKRVYSSKGARNSAASYFAFGSNILWGLITIPLAVKYLDKEEIGLWALVSTFAAYLSWMDLGISRSTGRLIAPAITSNNNHELNQWWSLLKLTLMSQSLATLIIGAAIIPWIPNLIGINQELAREAIHLLFGACLITALSMPIKCHMGLLIAQERYHWIPIFEGATLWANLSVFYVMLTNGFGMTSYLAAMAAGQGLLILCYLVITKFGSHAPRWERSGISWKRFRHLFVYSGNHALAGMADTLTRTLPNVIIGRLAGLSMIPGYNFSSKAPILGSQVICRTYYSFYPGLQNKFVAGQEREFERKFENIGMMTVGLCAVGAGIVLLANRTVVEILSASSFYIGGNADLWFAIAAIAYPTADIFRSLMTISGNMRRYGLISLLKCAVGCSAGIFMWHIFQLTGIAFTFAIIYLIDGSYSYINGTNNCNLGSRGPAFRILLHATAAVILTSLCHYMINKYGVPHEFKNLWGKDFSIPSFSTVICTLPIFGFGAFTCSFALMNKNSRGISS